MTASIDKGDAMTFAEQQNPDRVPIMVQCYLTRADYAAGWTSDPESLADSVRARLGSEIYGDDGGAYVPDITLVMIDGDDA